MIRAVPSFCVLRGHSLQLAAESFLSGEPCLSDLAFFLLGMYGKVAGMLIVVLILGIGHIGIHIQHKRDIGVEKSNGAKDL